MRGKTPFKPLRYSVSIRADAGAGPVEVLAVVLIEFEAIQVSADALPHCAHLALNFPDHRSASITKVTVNGQEVQHSRRPKLFQRNHVNERHVRDLRNFDVLCDERLEVWDAGDLLIHLPPGMWEGMLQTNAVALAEVHYRLCDDGKRFGARVVSGEAEAWESPRNALPGLQYSGGILSVAGLGGLSDCSWLPCVDNLCDRSAFELTFDLPAHWRVVCSGVGVFVQIQDTRRICQFVLDEEHQVPPAHVFWACGDLVSHGHMTLHTPATRVWLPKRDRSSPVTKEIAMHSTDRLSLAYESVRTVLNEALTRTSSSLEERAHVEYPFECLQVVFLPSRQVRGNVWFSESLDALEGGAFASVIVLDEGWTHSGDAGLDLVISLRRAVADAFCRSWAQQQVRLRNVRDWWCVDMVASVLCGYYVRACSGLNEALCESSRFRFRLTPEAEAPLHWQQLPLSWPSSHPASFYSTRRVFVRRTARAIASMLEARVGTSNTVALVAQLLTQDKRQRKRAAEQMQLILEKRLDLSVAHTVVPLLRNVTERHFFAMFDVDVEYVEQQDHANRMVVYVRHKSDELPYTKLCRFGVTGVSGHDARYPVLLRVHELEDFREHERFVTETRVLSDASKVTHVKPEETAGVSAADGGIVNRPRGRKKAGVGIYGGSVLEGFGGDRIDFEIRAMKTAYRGRRSNAEEDEERVNVTTDASTALSTLASGMGNPRDLSLHQWRNSLSVRTENDTAVNFLRVDPEVALATTALRVFLPVCYLQQQHRSFHDPKIRKDVVAHLDFVCSLGALDDETAGALLADTINDDSNFVRVRTSAALALARLRGSGVRDAVKNTLVDALTSLCCEDGRVRNNVEFLREPASMMLAKGLVRALTTMETLSHTTPISVATLLLRLLRDNYREKIGTGRLPNDDFWRATLCMALGTVRFDAKPLPFMRAPSRLLSTLQAESAASKSATPGDDDLGLQRAMEREFSQQQQQSASAVGATPAETRTPTRLEQLRDAFTSQIVKDTPIKRRRVDFLGIGMTSSKPTSADPAAASVNTGDLDQAVSTGETAPLAEADDTRAVLRHIVALLTDLLRHERIQPSQDHVVTCGALRALSLLLFNLQVRHADVGVDFVSYLQPSNPASVRVAAFEALVRMLTGAAPAALQWLPRWWAMEPDLTVQRQMLHRWVQVWREIRYDEQWQLFQAGQADERAEKIMRAELHDRVREIKHLRTMGKVKEADALQTRVLERAKRMSKTLRFVRRPPRRILSLTQQLQLSRGPPTLRDIGIAALGESLWKMMTTHEDFEVVRLVREIYEMRWPESRRVPSWATGPAPSLWRVLTADEPRITPSADRLEAIRCLLGDDLAAEVDGQGGVGAACFAPVRLQSRKTVGNNVNVVDDNGPAAAVTSRPGTRKRARGY
ncbi:MAG: hypothetical protein MHM6MM_001760 [Cercozoa sp. M6MM]